MEEQVNNMKSNEDKTVAILAYITLIGWIIALIMHNGDNKTKLGGFHIRQSLGIMVYAVAIVIIGIILAFIPFLGAFISIILNLSILVAWIMGLIGAASGEMKPLPVIGQYFQDWFASVARD